MSSEFLYLPLHVNEIKICHLNVPETLLLGGENANIFQVMLKLLLFSASDAIDLYAKCLL